jgi:hypothetical protein
LRKRRGALKCLQVLKKTTGYDTKTIRLIHHVSLWGGVVAIVFFIASEIIGKQ